MNQEQIRQFEDMKRELADLKRWKEERQSNQIKMPLDVISKSVLYENIPVYKRAVAGAVAVGGYITTEINGLEVNILIK